MVAKSRRPQAERAAEWALHDMGCLFTRRAVRTKFTAVDFFGCDLIGVRCDGTRLWVQVTAGQTPAVLARRRKLETYPWHISDQVYVWQLVERQDVANPRRKDWHFRIWEYQVVGNEREWTDDIEPIHVPIHWFHRRSLTCGS